MVKVINQVEMMKYSGVDKVVFPIGTIITPSAKDWAQEHDLNIIIGECSEKDVLLQQVIKSVIDNMAKVGGSLSKDELAKAVTSCLQKLGCQVDC